MKTFEIKKITRDEMVVLLHVEKGEEYARLFKSASFTALRAEEQIRARKCTLEEFIDRRSGQIRSLARLGRLVSIN